MGEVGDEALAEHLLRTEREELLEGDEHEEEQADPDHERAAPQHDHEHERGDEGEAGHEPGAGRPVCLGPVEGRARSGHTPESTPPA